MHVREIVDTPSKKPATNLLGAVLGKSASFAPFTQLARIKLVQAGHRPGSRQNRQFSHGENAFGKDLVNRVILAYERNRNCNRQPERRRSATSFQLFCHFLRDLLASFFIGGGVESLEIREQLLSFFWFRLGNVFDTFRDSAK